MEGAIFFCPAAWSWLLPPGVRRVETAEALTGRDWDLVALTREGCGRLREREVRCRTLLVPGDCDPGLLAWFQPRTVISFGMSPRDSLTLSSVAEPVLCVQRALPRADGTVVEPQEFPLPALPGGAEALLPLLGLRLLQMPLTEQPLSW